MNNVQPSFIDRIEAAFYTTVRNEIRKSVDKTKCVTSIEQLLSTLMGIHPTQITGEEAVKKIWAEVRGGDEVKLELLLDFSNMLFFSLGENGKMFSELMADSIISLSAVDNSYMDKEMKDRSIYANAPNRDKFKSIITSNFWLAAAISLRYVSIFQILEVIAADE